ncbi:MAG: Peptidase, M23/M37 family [uncultured bacterium]|nr:MAG: Peptidase, M23/M37 family [uncultured bacterium]
MKYGKILFSFVFSIALFISVYTFARSQTCTNSDECTRLIDEYSNQIQKLQGQGNTLKNQIAQFDAQIKLTSLKIAQTEEQIKLLSGRIDQISGSVESLNEAFSQRAIETYKMARIDDPFILLLSSDNLTEAYNRLSYLKKIQEGDRNLLVRLQKAQDTYEEEKVDQEDLQTKLAGQKKNLDLQKGAKANLLSITKNDEKKYQQLLAQVRAEYEAIQAIIAGKGTETEVGQVSEGQRIANTIQGSSCNSSGSHVHFIVRKQNSTTDNPFSYLKSGISYQNCSGSSCGSNDGDSFNPSGSWIWPIQSNIKFSQGYGNTWAVRNTWVGRIYNFHNGIDINSDSSSEVKAVKSGKLYQGSYNVGCRLKYVRVDHDDSDLDTLYLHVNY